MKLQPEDVVVEEPADERCGCPARSLGMWSGCPARSPVWSCDVTVVVEDVSVMPPRLVPEDEVEVEVEVEAVELMVVVVVGVSKSPGVLGVVVVEWGPVIGPSDDWRAATEKTGRTD